MNLSSKYGLNPSISVCCICGRDTDLVLMGHLPNDAETPRSVLCSLDPCDSCKELMTQGVILFCANEQDGIPVPTGKLVVVTEDFIRRTILPEVAVKLIYDRVGALEPTTFDTLFTEENIQKGMQK